MTIVCQDVQVTEKKEVQLGVLPEELRPSVRFVGFGVIPGSSSTGQIAANVSGNVRIYSASGTGAFTASLTYPIVYAMLFMYSTVSVIFKSLHVPLLLTSLFWIPANAVPSLRSQNCVTMHEPV